MWLKKGMRMESITDIQQEPEQSMNLQQILRDKYEVMQLLGKGGTGEVLLVKDRDLNRLAAAKRVKKYKYTEEELTVRGDTGEREQQCVEYFRQEMELLKQLKHRGLPDVYDFFEEQDWFYLIMEYVEGITLEQYLEKNQKIAVEECLKWAIELTDVLEYLHSRHPAVIYRDLKPGNIMIKPGGELMLIDLGSCTQGGHMGRRQEGCVGTPGYAPPEQWQIEGTTERSDMYAFGVVLHEMLTGVSPRKSGYIRRPVKEYDRSIPVRLERVICKCTEACAADRYPSMENVREALLHNIMEERLIRAGGIIRDSLRVLLWTGLLISLGIPLVRGIPETQLPFPYFYRPLFFMVAIILWSEMIGRRKYSYVKKIEKSILVTEKKFELLFSRG